MEMCVGVGVIHVVKRAWDAAGGYTVTKWWR